MWCDGLLYPRTSRERSIELGMWAWRILWLGKNVECRMIMTWYDGKEGRQARKMKKHKAKREHYNKEFYSTFIRHPSTLFKKKAIKHYHLPLRFLFFFFCCSFLLPFENLWTLLCHISSYCTTIPSIIVVQSVVEGDEEKNITMFYFFPLSSLFIFLLWRRRIPSTSFYFIAPSWHSLPCCIILS